jgi:homoserine kinase
VVAGIIAARGLIAEPEALSDDVVIDLAASIEGHPDNAAPAVLGGATLAWKDASGFRAIGLPVDPSVVPIAIVPPTHLSTKAARGVLPATVPHADGAFQAGRAALLVEALGRRPELLLTATEDRLHQEYRRSVMPDSLALVDTLRSRGVAAVVSGAGPTVLVLARAVGSGTDADDAIAAAFGGAMGGWRVLPLTVDRAGATVELGSPSSR